MDDQLLSIIAFSTYGTHTKTHRGKRLSALKIGYTGIISNILLKLFQSAIDISTKRDTYKYLYLPNKPKLHHNWLLVELTSAELELVERLCISHNQNHGIAVWQKNKWMLLPIKDQPQYQELSSNTPKYNPVGYWSIRTDGSKGSIGGSRNSDQLIAEYSKLYANKPAWWWIPGNDATYKNRENLKRYGCRWKRNRRAYVYIGDKLPDELLALLSNSEECQSIMAGIKPDDAKQKYRNSSTVVTDDVEDTEPCSLEEVQSILGITPIVLTNIVTFYEPGRVAWTTRNISKDIEGRAESIPVGTKYTILSVDASGDPLNPAYIIQYGDKTARVLEEEIIPMRIFETGNVVYARQESKTSQGDIITTGTKGKITKLYGLNRNMGSRHSYDVDWEGVGTEWMFEDELCATAPDPNIRITRGTVVPGGQGSTIADERKAILEGGHQPQALEVVVEKCICEDMDGPVGWLPAKHLGTWVACGSCNPQGKNLLQSDPTNPNANKPPAIRIIKPTALDDEDEIAQAVRQTSVPQINQTPSVSYHAKVTPLPMACVGELTGSVMANVHCYGYALDGDELIFLNMGGPRSGIEAIRAKLGKGDIVNLMRWDDPSIELSAGEGNTGVYTAYINNMAEARFVHCMLAHERLVHPNYNGNAKTYIIQMSETQAKAQLLHHVRETVKLPVFPDWIDYLWQVGQVAKLVRNTRTGGGLIIKAIDLDVDAWGRLIQYGVAEKTITIPQLQQA